MSEALVNPLGGTATLLSAENCAWDKKVTL